MAGGKGTRLKPYTMSIPKPLLPIGETPIIELVLIQLARNGIKKVIITLSHMAPIFQLSLGNGDKFGIDISYVVEDIPLGTAGALRIIEDIEENFLVLNGDLLTTFNYRDFYLSHVEKKVLASIAVHKRIHKVDYGVIESDEDGFLKKYIEKPTIPYEVSMGINMFSRKALDFIPNKVRFDIPDLMMAIRDANKDVYCYSTDCYWQDIGRFSDYQKASEDFVNDPSYFI